MFSFHRSAGAGVADLRVAPFTVDEMRRRPREVPTDTPVVAYCRGPFRLTARDAVGPLRKRGFRALHLTDGVAEWGARGLPIETSPETP